MKIVHHYVDLDGKTYIDEYSTRIPLTDNESTETYHIVLLLPQNSRILYSLYEEYDDVLKTPKDEVLVAAVPDKYQDVINDFEAAKYEVRRICFETPSPEFGGVRPVCETDLATAKVITCFKDCYPAIYKVLIDFTILGKAISSKAIAFQTEDASLISKLRCAISAHPLWKRMSFLALHPDSFAAILCLIPSPIWFLDTKNPLSSTKIRTFCGLDDPEQHFNLLAHALFLTHEQYDLTSNEINIKNYFSALGLRAMLWADGFESNMRYVIGKWYQTLRIVDYFWLNFLELHRDDSPFMFDENKFFNNKQIAEDWGACLI